MKTIKVFISHGHKLEFIETGASVCLFLSNFKFNIKTNKTIIFSPHWIFELKCFFFLTLRSFIWMLNHIKHKM